WSGEMPNLAGLMSPRTTRPAGPTRRASSSVTSPPPQPTSRHDWPAAMPTRSKSDTVLGRMTRASTRRRSRPSTPPRMTYWAVSVTSIDRLDAAGEALDPRQVDPIRIGDAGAVAIGEVRVHSQHDVRAAQQIRSAGVAEAETALAGRGIRGQLDELDALHVVALNQQARREEAREEEDVAGLAAAADEPLHAVADQ